MGKGLNVLPFWPFLPFGLFFLNVFFSEKAFQEEAAYRQKGPAQRLGNHGQAADAEYKENDRAAEHEKPTPKERAVVVEKPTRPERPCISNKLYHFLI